MTRLAKVIPLRRATPAVVYRTECFLCGVAFRTEHDPLKVPPACNACRGEREAAKLDGNDR